MDNLLSQVDEKISNYRHEHHGENPLYLLLTNEESVRLAEAIRQREGYGANVPITEYKGTKIVKNDSVKPGEIRLTNEAPELSS